MSEIATITAEDVRWEEGEFEEAAALAVLLSKEVIILNDHWWRDDLKPADQARISVAVVCNDVFAWGCADAEVLPYRAIKPLYEAWEADQIWGPSAWCISVRKRMPQPPVAKLLRERGYDVERLVAGELHSPQEPRP